MEFNNIPLNLILVQEECAEVIQAISKMQRFGRMGEHNGVGNEERLKKEVGDLFAVLGILDESMGWSIDEMALLIEAKHEKLEKWYD